MNNSGLVKFYHAEEYIGYCFVNDGQVVEFSHNPTPYDLVEFIPEGYEYYYDITNYGLINDDFVQCIDSDGSFLTDPLNVSSMGQPNSAYGIIPGVSPQLQGQSNCIAAALANVMWYWKSHGWSSLAPSGFSTLKANLHNRFSTIGFANNNVLTVANQYGATCVPRVWFSGNVYWSYSPSYLIYEINAGYPCMLGYAAGDTSQGLTYSSSVGHMTMCFGYYYVGNQLYVTVGDGHVAGTTTKIWSVYNDCTIAVRPYSL